MLKRDHDDTHERHSGDLTAKAAAATPTCAPVWKDFLQIQYKFLKGFLVSTCSELRNSIQIP